MKTIIGLALSLALTHKGPNGFDPTTMYVLVTGAHLFKVDGNQQAFRDWLHRDLQHNPDAIKYFVACAFDDGVKITFEDPPTTYTWYGRLGLSSQLQRDIETRYKKDGPPVNLLIPAEEGKWVSACLMAHANMKGSHEYISLRGNPEAWAASPPSLAELWTMGYPEGVFFADLLNFNISGPPNNPRMRQNPPPANPTKDQLEQSFTLSLDLPENYQGPVVAKWAPPNGANGRVLDFLKVISVTHPMVGPYRLAENLGTYLEKSPKLVDEPHPSDPHYKKGLVCVAPALSPSPFPAPSPIPREVVDCNSSKAMRLRPLFVHAPRVAGLASATRVNNPELVIQAIDTGADAFTPVQLASCGPVVDCTGPFHLTAEGEAPEVPTAAELLNSRKLAGLGAKQAVTVVLRRPPSKPVDPLDPGERFTAIVRYRSKGDAAGSVEVSGRGGTPRAVQLTWTKTPTDAPTGWQWMQVYPVYAVPDHRFSGGRLALTIRISGTAGDQPAPEFDLAGFVNGAPWCVTDAAGSFAAVCPGQSDQPAMLRSRVTRAISGPRPVTPAPTAN